VSLERFARYETDCRLKPLRVKYRDIPMMAAPAPIGKRPDFDVHFPRERMIAGEKYKFAIRLDQVLRASISYWNSIIN
jgi:hypothetical protein